MTRPTARPTLQSDAVREHNRAAVLRRLQDGGAWSRAGLARAVGLSVPTVAAIATDLADAGLLREAGLARPAGGRPARTVRLRPEAAGVLALDLSGARVRAARVDLLGALHPCSEGPAVEPGADGRLLGHVEATLAELAEAGTPVHALAVAVPGVVDRAGATVRLAPALGWNDEPVGARLRERTGLPVLLENDVNALAVAEMRAAGTESRASLVVVAVARGIGAGVVIDGRLHRGAHAAAGEIGYALPLGAVDAPDGPAPMDLGAPGPFERELQPWLQACLEGGRVVEGPDATSRLEAAAVRLHPLLHTLACALDPERIVISWPVDPEGRLAARIARRWQAPVATRITPSALGADAALRGVGTLALDALCDRLCAGLGTLAGPPAGATTGATHDHP